MHERRRDPRRSGGRGGGDGPGRLGDGRARLDPELAPEQLGAAGGLPGCADPVACRGEAADEEDLVALVERIGLDEARREVGGARRVAGREPGEGRLAQDRLRRAGQMPSLRREPDLERRAAGEVHALQELAPDAAAVRLAHVDERARRQAQRDRVAVDADVAEQPSQRAEVPAQRRLGIVRLGEQQRRQLVAARRPVRQQEVREHAPRLVAAGSGDRGAAALDARPAEEVDREVAHGSTILAGPASGR